MSDKLDIKKPVKEILLDKFNAKSGLQIPPNYVELGAVTTLPDPTDKEDTKVEFIPTTIASFLNTFHLTYKKIDLSDVFGLPYIRVPSDNFNTLYELLDNINDAIGLNLTVDDVEPTAVDTTDPNGAKVLIKTLASSYLYKGEVLLELDKTLNVPVTRAINNTVIYVHHKVTAGLDYIKAHAFDGYNGNSFSYLRNISLVTKSKITNIFSVENSILVVSGEFQLVAAQLSFINPAVTYKTITLDRLGNILSARIEETLLTKVPFNDISIDVNNKYFYLVDKSATINQNNKHAYRLFENGTLDTTFNHSSLPSGVFKILPARDGYFVISKTGLNFSIKKYSLAGNLDLSFNEVKINTSSPGFTDILGYVYYTTSDEEYIELAGIQPQMSAQLAPVYDAIEVITVKSTTLADFYSPIFTITNNGSKVVASGDLAKYNRRETLETSYIYPKLFKNVKGSVAIYALNTFGYLKNPTLTSLFFGEEKEYQPNFINIQDSLNIIDVKKIYQVYSGNETYSLVRYVEKINNPTNQESTGIISFDNNHKYLGFISISNDQSDILNDFAILNR